MQSNAIQLNLGIDERIFVERVISALTELGAIEASSAVITERLADQLVRMGVHTNARIVGATLGNARVLEGCMYGYSRFLGGRREPWQGYEWFLPVHAATSGRSTWFRKMILRSGHHRSAS